MKIETRKKQYAVITCDFEGHNIKSKVLNSRNEVDTFIKEDFYCDDYVVIGGYVLKDESLSETSGSFTTASSFIKN